MPTAYIYLFLCDHSSWGFTDPNGRSDPAGDPWQWNDNWLYSNVPLIFRRNGDDPNMYCTRITGTDTGTLHAWDNAYLCEPILTPQPKNPLECSNAGIKSFTRKDTCAAEVFDFSPEVFIKTKQTGEPQPLQFDRMTGLPPVL